MYRRGIVSAIQLKPPRAKVKFPDKGNVESYWLEVLQQNTHLNKDEALPDVGELVAVLMDDRDEAGLILGAIYTDANQPTEPSQDKRRVTFGDGTVVEYDRSSHTLLISGAALVKVTGDGTQIELDGNVKVKGGLSPVALATKSTAALNALKAAITAAPVVPGDGGASFKASLSGALGSWPPNLDAGALSSD